MHEPLHFTHVETKEEVEQRSVPQAQAGLLRLIKAGQVALHGDGGSACCQRPCSLMPAWRSAFGKTSITRLPICTTPTWFVQHMIVANGEEAVRVALVPPHEALEMRCVETVFANGASSRTRNAVW
ncbi:MAG: hypothetical protein IPH53_22520 [Flavobacteriales bacterium]|nr:hypothetical protein [Flavobacteriales bacterium]